MIKEIYILLLSIMAQPIKFYKKEDKYYSFTNFAPIPITIDGKVWPTSEHYFQACKSLDANEREMVRRAKSPRDALDMGRNVKLRADWENKKDKVMMSILMAKFTQNMDARNELLSTYPHPLIEDSPVDSYWGCGSDGKGKNKLGKMLVIVRDHIRMMFGVAEEIL
jgi:ribA/ribD-fused uncharacterized protein